MANHSQSKYCGEECRLAANRVCWNKYGERNRDKRRLCHRIHYSLNKDAVCRRIDQYRKTDAGKLAVHKATINGMRKFPEKYRARMEVLMAMRKGEIVKPENCVKCGARERIQAHHTDYTKPLIVEWLCRGCHAAAHKALKN
jgi:hypothetical protein